MFIKITSTTG